MKKIKIAEWWISEMDSAETLYFSDGSYISFDHDQDCCENNYADFSQLEESALDYEFELPILFEKVEGAGFRFGDYKRKFFIPCYSEQNGYYTSELDIYYTHPVLHIDECQYVDC